MAQSDSSGNSVIATVSAVYTLLQSAFTICGALGVLLGGALFGAFGGALNEAAEQSGTSSAELAEAQAVIGSGTAIFTLLGAALLVIGIALLVVGIGVFMKRGWAYMGMIIVHAAYVVLTLLSVLTSGDIGANVINLVLVALSSAIVFLFWTNDDIKAMFGRA